MPKKTALPKQLFVRLEIPDNDRDNAYFSAHDKLEDSMADSDGPEEVGVYQLVETKHVKKVIQDA